MHFTKILKLTNTYLNPILRLLTMPNHLTTTFKKIHIHTVTHNQILFKFCDFTNVRLNKSFELFGQKAIFEKRQLTI